MTDPRLQALLDQLDTIWLLLERPVIQRQLIAFALIFLLSWLLPAPLGAWLNRMLNRQQAIERRQKGQGLPVSAWQRRTLRWARGSQLIIFPLVGLISSQAAAGYFWSQGWPAGLLIRLQTLFWLVLAYRLIEGLLFGTLETDKAQYYQKRFVRPLFLVLIIITFGAGLAASFPIFEITLFSLLETSVTARSIASAVVVFYIFLAASWIVRDLLRNVVQPRIGADPGVMSTVGVISNYAIVGIGVLTAASILGFDLSALAIIGGGLSVGIGFGLQELVANFISGILLLFEQTLRPGDMVEVGGQRGTVNQLRMRATVLRTADNVEVLVPNKTLLTSTVANYTNINRTALRTLSVGVSYAADPQRVRDVLMNIANSHGQVLNTPAPAVFFSGFGESSLDFELIVWVGDSPQANRILSDLRFMIFKEFKKNGIEIPYPQRDLHLRDGRLGIDQQVAKSEDRSPEDDERTEAAGDATPVRLVPAEKPRLP